MTRELKYALLSEDLVLTSKAPPIELPDVYLSELLHHKLTVHHEKVIFIDSETGDTMNGWNIRDTASTIAQGLLDYGIHEGDVIFGYCPNSSVYACCLLSTALIGTVFTGCMYSYPLRDLQLQLLDSDAKVLLCSVRNVDIASEAVDAIPDIILLIVLDADFREVRLTPGCKRIISIEQILSRCYRPNDKQLPIIPLNHPPSKAVAFSIYSSGSTGLPKGALKTHRNFVADILGPETWLHFAFHEPKTDVVSGHMTFAHSTGIITIVNAMYFGCKVVISDGFEVERFLSSVEKYRISHSFLSPPYIVMLAKGTDLEKYDVSSLESIICGGAPLPQSIIEPFLQRLNCHRFSQIYGMTEAGIVTCLDLDCKNYNTVGRPLRGIRIKIVDRESGKELSFNQTGEFYVDGPEKTIGYFKRPEADIENFTADGWIKTGDAAYFDEDGLIYIVDRYKDVIKVDTLQVAPPELESVLMTNESVAEVAVVGVVDDVHGEVPKAFIVPKEGHESLNEEDIMSFVNDQVAKFKQIRSVVFLKSLPKISFGKIDRNRLKKDPDSLETLHLTHGA